MINATLIFLIISAGTSFILSLIIITRSSRERQDWLFGITTLVASLWTASHIAVHLFGYAYPVLLLITYFISSFIFSTLLLFIIFFIQEQKKNRRWLIGLTIALNAAIAVLTFIPGAIVDNISIAKGGQVIHLNFGPYYVFFGLYMAAFAVATISVMAYAYYYSSGIKRKQIAFMFFGTVIASLIGFSTDLILPTLGIYHYMGKGPVAILIFTLFIYYAILKYHLLEIRVIAAEIFSGLLLATALLNFLTAKTTADIIKQGLILLVLAVFAYFLVRSVMKEIRSREEVLVLAEHLRVANSELQRLDQAKSEFISIASHQLRAPLTAIKGYISMILEGMFGAIVPQMKEVLERVYASNERLIKLVEDMLNLSRIEAGRMRYDIKIINIDDVLGSVVEEFANVAHEKNIELRWVKSSPPVMVRADTELLHQVFTNLIDNAIRYTDSGHVAVFVLHRNPEDTYVTLCVEDTGAGIDAEEMTHLFKQFERGGAGRERGITGFGFGLYIAKKIVEEGHQGKLWAESEGKGKGAKFFVQIPLAK